MISFINEVVNIFWFRQKSFRFHGRIWHTLQFSISATFRQRFPEASKRSNVSPGFHHALMCLRERNTERVIMYLALLGKQW